MSRLRSAVWPLAWGVLAAVAAMGLTFALRAAFQVRTLPERMMEWLLLYVPIDAFASGIQTLGPQAKVLALYGSGAVMTASLVGLGALALWRRWSPLAVLGLAAALYIVAMGILMPLTGGGFFGAALPQHPLLANAAYACIALGYGTVLLAGRAFGSPAHASSGSPPISGRSRAPGSRRALALSAAGTGVAYATAWRQASIGGGAAGSSLPLAQLPPDVGGASAPAPAPPVHPGLRDAPTVLTPELIARATSAPTESAPLPAPGPAAVPAEPAPDAPAATQDTSPPPAAPATRQLTRDQDGALTAAVRQKGELAALVTPTAAHYVVAKNAVADPVLEAEAWRLVLDGEVNRPVQLDFRTLRGLPAVEVHKTLECISNFTAACELTYFGCDLISTAQWTGARLRDVLELAGGLKPGTVSLQVTGADEYSSAIPPALATNPDTLLVYEMNGQPLPRQHGHPVRLLSPGRYGYKSAKWVVGIRALRTEHVDWYGQRNWSRTGIVKTMSRIDVPANGARLAPGRHAIAGIAYAGDRGVGAVQFSANAGRTWNPTAFLEPPLGKDTWVRWTAEFDIAPGQTLSLQCRAIDGTGQVQTATFSLPQPNGGSGQHTIEVSAAA
ncbi:MAG: hypothetical protein AVDCRST_MAG77-129 [uncultured Chloroflexi bacterium]|uniref:Oxidoreductase molybdopterin-binding domain-containing protein n=1 Tax=uncultured Chloroflexota bacterium TaxID=166587 RepID=A0A6J4H6C3_9CHLR|nr:MAG: hypothetical protein AVDCRST_MAG77-129 [uncultured Chloroflexota bacterium]